MPLIHPSNPTNGVAHSVSRTVAAIQKGGAVLLLSPSDPWSHQVAAALKRARAGGAVLVDAAEWEARKASGNGSSTAYKDALTATLPVEGVPGDAAMPEYPEDFMRFITHDYKLSAGSAVTEGLAKGGKPGTHYGTRHQPIDPVTGEPRIDMNSITVAVPEAVLRNDSWHFPTTRSKRVNAALDIYRAYVNTMEGARAVKESSFGLPMLVEEPVGGGDNVAGVVCDNAVTLLQALKTIAVGSKSTEGGAKGGGNGEPAGLTGMDEDAKQAPYKEALLAEEGKTEPESESAETSEEDLALASTRSIAGSSSKSSKSTTSASSWWHLDPEIAGFGAKLDDLERVRSQQEYHDIVKNIHRHMEDFERRLASKRFLHGNSPTLADLQLFSFLVRWDTVYYGVFKATKARLKDFPNLAEYTRDVYQSDKSFALSLDWHYILHHYYRSFPDLITPTVPPLTCIPDLSVPTDRDWFMAMDTSRAKQLQAEGTEEQTTQPKGSGEFKRKQSKFRHWVTEELTTPFPAESGRYHLFVANNCPWCHRTLLTRSLKHLERHISVTVCWYRRDGERGWQFNPKEPGCTENTVADIRYIPELYKKEGSEERSLPILYDKKTKRIVNNESADIVRMLNFSFNDLPGVNVALDLCPADLRPRIEWFNSWIYTDINNGAYKAGFSSGQRSYDEAYRRFFRALRRLNAHFEYNRFLCGNTFTEADVRLFPTIFRFDEVYFVRMKLNEIMVKDLPYLHRWLLDMWSIPEIRRASNMRHCKAGYFGRSGNGIIPEGPGYEARVSSFLLPAPDFARSAAYSEAVGGASTLSAQLASIDEEGGPGAGTSASFYPLNADEEREKVATPKESAVEYKYNTSPPMASPPTKLQTTGQTSPVMTPRPVSRSLPPPMKQSKGKRSVLRTVVGAAGLLALGGVVGYFLGTTRDHAVTVEPIHATSGVTAQTVTTAPHAGAHRHNLFSNLRRPQQH